MGYSLAGETTNHIGLYSCRATLLTLKRRRVWRIVREHSRSVIRADTGKSGSYEDRPNHS